MPGMGPSQMQPPQPQMPQQGFPQQPQMGGYPPGMPPMPPVPQPQQGFPQPQQQQQFTPPQAPAQPAPAMFGNPPQQASGAQPPTKVEAARQWGKAGTREDGSFRTRRTKEEVAEDAAYEAWVAAGGDPNVGSTPQQAPQQVQQPQQPPPQIPQPQVQAPPQMVAPPNPFGNVPNNAMGMAPAAFQQQPPAAPATPHATEEQVAQLQSRIGLLEKGLALVLRILYQAGPGDNDLYVVLTEVCKIRP